MTKLNEHNEKEGNVLSVCDQCGMKITIAIKFQTNPSLARIFTTDPYLTKSMIMMISKGS